jgi:hypothetical protein
MTDPKSIQIKDYNYPLPDERIAKYPLPERDSSKLLLYRHGVIGEDRFFRISEHLPEHALMVFNNTKVVQARLHFHKETGAQIEVFILEPAQPAEYQENFLSRGRCEWLCLVGNLKKWKGGTLSLLLPGGEEVTAERLGHEGTSERIRFSWTAPLTWAEILEQAGELQKIYERWFHPERVHDDASPMALYILGGLLVVGLIAFLLSRITSVRVKKAVRRSSDLNNIMHQAMDMGEYYVMEYDIQTGRVSNVYGNLLPAEGVSIDDSVGRVSAEEREGFRESLEQMKRGEKSQWTVRKRFNAGTAAEPNWRRLYGNVILEYVGKRPRYIVNTVKDLTRETEID